MAHSQCHDVHPCTRPSCWQQSRSTEKSITETEKKHSHLKDTLRACHVGWKLHIQGGGANLTEQYLLYELSLTTGISVILVLYLTHNT